MRIHLRLLNRGLYSVPRSLWFFSKNGAPVMDYTTSFVFFLISLGLFTVALSSLAAVDRNVLGARWLAASTLVELVKVFLQGIIGYTPRFFSIFLTHELNIVSTSLMFLGLRWFIVRTPFRRWGMASLVAADMTVYAAMFRYHIHLWSFTVAALPVLGIMTALTWMLFRQKDPRFAIPSRLAASFLGTHVLLLLYRCVLSLDGLSGATTVAPWSNPAWRYSTLAIMLMSYCMLLMYVLFTVVEMHSSVAHAAGVDALTGALNRRAWMEHGSRELARCERRAQPIALVALDLDQFKRLNDTHGHAGGDVALCAFVDLAKEKLRQGDMIARLGGEEFALLLPGFDTLDAVRVAEDLRHSLEQMRVHYDGSLIQTTTSAGVTEMHPGDSLEEMLKRADAALYRAKSEGRNRVATDEPLVYPAKPVLVERYRSTDRQDGMRIAML